MRRSVDRFVTVLLSAALVVVGLELASYAANGRAFTLGGRNTESRPASLANTGKGRPSFFAPTARRSRWATTARSSTSTPTLWTAGAPPTWRRPR